MKMTKYLIFSVILLVLPFFLVFAHSDDWEEAFKITYGRVLCLGSLDGTDMIYVGTDKGLFKTVNAGKSWEEIPFPGSVFGVRDIAFKGDSVFLATGNGIYVGSKEGSWRLAPGMKNISGLDEFHNKKKRIYMLAWSGSTLYKEIENGWKRIISPWPHGDEIDEVVSGKGVIFAISGTSVFWSLDEGDSWEKVTLYKRSGFENDQNEYGIYEEDASEKESLKYPFGDRADLCGEDGIAIATREGIFIVNVENKILKRISTTGLPSVRIKDVACAGENIFAATDSTVFQYMPGEMWSPVFSRPIAGVIEFIEIIPDNKGRKWLWVASRKLLYKADVDSITFRRVANEGFFSRKTEAPTIREVHRMAVDYAEVSPEKIKEWRSAARWKGIMPRVSLSFSESSDDNVEIYKSSTTSYIVRGPREIDTDWDIGLTWDLSDLVWNSAQTSIDVRSKLMVQLRDEILEEITRLYFERKKLLIELEDAKPKEGPKLREKRLRIEELTAHIDALTGGKFSEAIAD